MQQQFPVILCVLSVLISGSLQAGAQMTQEVSQQCLVTVEEMTLLAVKSFTNGRVSLLIFKQGAPAFFLFLFCEYQNEANGHNTSRTEILQSPGRHLTSIFPEQNSKFFTVYDKVPNLSKIILQLLPPQLKTVISLTSHQSKCGVPQKQIGRFLT